VPLEEVVNHVGVGHDHFASDLVADHQGSGTKISNNLYESFCSLRIKLCISLEYLPSYRRLKLETGGETA